MAILHHLAPSVLTSPPVLFLPAPPKRLALSAPKIAGYLPIPKVVTAGGDVDSPLQRVAVMPAKIEPPKPAKRVVVAEIVNPLDLIDIRRNPKAWWEEFERIHGKIQTIEEMDAEIEAKVPGYLNWVARMNAKAAMEAEAVSA